MTAFSDSFRAEVARIARRETKDDMVALRKAVASYRSEIAALKREIRELASHVKEVAKRVNRSDVAIPTNADKPKKRRTRAFVFSHDDLIAKREALGLTQKQMALLLGISAASVYKWETGTVAPRRAQLDRVREMLKIGAREARSRLASIAPDGSE